MQILEYTIPSLLVFLATFLIMKKFFDNDYQKRVFELKLNSQKIITPARLQAYERIAIFIERVAISSLLRRYDLSKMTAYQLHRALLKNISDEFEHNISQQIYVSNATWKLIKETKDTTINSINQSFKETLENYKVADKSTIKSIPALAFGKNIIDNFVQDNPDITNSTLAVLKKEIKTYF